jgi:dipeptide transport system substrate-binding protein
MRLMKTLLAASAIAVALAGGAYAKTLVYCSEGSPEGFDPAAYTAGTTFDASSRTAYSRLVEFKPGETTIVPGLAEKWDISPDGLTYTFHLRQGVKFQTTDYFTPTRGLTADDVVFSFQRQLDKNNPWYSYTDGISYDYFDSMSLPTELKSAEKLDDYTVRFTLNTPDAAFLADLGMDFASIVSKEYADSLDKAGNKGQMNQKPVGTGPFIFVDYQQDAAIRYKANPDYFGDKPKVDDLVFAITPDASVRAQKLKAGECDIIPYPNPADVPDLKADADLSVQEQSGLNVAYLAYNTRQPPFDKPEVRRALNQAFNRDAIIQAVYGGNAIPAVNPIPPTMWGYNKETRNEDYNPDAAKKALADAGVTNLTMKIWNMPVSRPYNPNGKRMAELMQADLAKIGVTATIDTMDWAQYLKALGALDRDGAMQAGWTGDNGDPDNFFAVLLGCDGAPGNNKANWCDKDFDALIKKAKTTSDQAERAKLYEQASVIFKEQAPWFTIAHSQVFMPMNKKVTGFVMSPLGYHEFGTTDKAE